MIARVISGGQTGVDRGALDAALELGVAAGGWCPAGRRAEDGAIPARYPLSETESADYLVRTEANVRDSDGTLILVESEPLTGGTAATKRYGRTHRKPVLVALLGDADSALAAIERWLTVEKIATLNVAGPRESGAPGIQEKATVLMRRLLSRQKPGPQDR